MNLSDEQITAAPVPLVLTKDGKKLELLMSPLRDIDFSSLNQWLRHRVVSFAYQNLPDKSADTLELRQEIIGVATKQAASISWHSVDGIKMLETAEGMARLVWQCSKANYQGVLTHEELIPYFHNPENIQAYGRAFNIVNPELVAQSNKENSRVHADEIEFPDLASLPKKNGEKKGSKQKKTKKQKSIDF